MEIGLRYNLDLFESVTDILSKDFWVLENINFKMLPKLTDPVKFTSNASILVKKGQCDIDIDLIKYHINEPSIVNIRSAHILQWEGVTEDFEASVIVISNRFYENLFILLQDCKAYNVATTNRVVSVPLNLLPKFEKFYSHISEIFASSKDKDAYQAMLLAIASFFYECGAKCYYPILERMPRSQNRIPERFISLVQKNFKRERFLDFYASQLELTTKHLSRSVKSFTGYSAVDWIDRYVILEAKVLLKSTNLTIQQISDELNFTSQSLFGKYFKKHVGMSPKDFRNS